MLIRNRKFARAHAGRSSVVSLKPDGEAQESLALPNIPPKPNRLYASKADTCPIHETITDMCPYVKMRITGAFQNEPIEGIHYFSVSIRSVYRMSSGLMNSIPIHRFPNYGSDEHNKEAIK